MLTLYRNRFVDTANNERRICRADEYFDISIGGIKNTRVYYEGRIESLNNSNENDNNTNQDVIDDNTNTFDNAS